MWKGAAGHAFRNIDASNNLLPGGTPLSTDTLSHIYSVTKTFTAALVIELAQEGVLDLDAPVGNYIPLSYINPQLSDRVTLRQLMSHHTGFSDYVHDMKFLQSLAFNPNRMWRSHEAIAFAKKLAEPGTVYSYSSTNYVILGFIVETVTGRPVEQLYRERFLAPLSLKNTYLAAREDRGSRGKLAAPHDNLSPFNPIFYAFGKPLYPNAYTNISRFPFTAIMSSVHAGGAMVSNVDDMISWGSALFGGKATSQATLDIMLNSFPETNGIDGDLYGYGLTISKRMSDTEVFIGHGGSATGYRALLVHQPAKKITIAIASNFAAADVYAIARAIYEALPAYSCGESGAKIQLCFNGNSICVAKEALPALLKQGAFIGSCQSATKATTASASKALDQAKPLASIAAYPNPFRDNITLSFSVDKAGPVSLTIFDLQGKVITSLYEGTAEAGVHQVNLDSKQLPTTGIYIAKLNSASGVKTQRIVLTK